MKDDSDKKLWEQVMQSIRPLHNNVHNSFESLKSVKKKQSKVHRTQDFSEENSFIGMLENFQPGVKPSLIKESMYLSHGDSLGMNKADAKRFSTGKIPIDSRLDLHGNTLDIAYKKVHSFIHNCVTQKYRCVIIITGKGTGKLQSNVPDWLNQHPINRHIVTYDYAQPKDGGTGALYVYLRRKT